MKFGGCVILALVALGGSTSVSSHVSPVQKVIQLIDDMAIKVKKDLETTNLGFEEFAKNCDDEAAEKDNAISNSKNSVYELEASVFDSSGKIASLESKIADVSTKISSTEDDVAAAENLREQEHQDFLAVEKSMLQTINELQGAAAQLRGGTGFVQLTPEARQGLNSVLTGLGKVVDANFVTHEAREKVQAFLQAQEDAQDSLEVKQPESGAMDGVMATISELTEKAESTLAATRKREQESAHSHVMLKQSMANDLSSMREEMSESTKLKAYNAEAKATSEKDLAAEQKILSGTTKYLSDLKQDCQERATAFEAETRDINAELTALGKAKEILTKKFGALLQMTVKVAAKDDEDTRAQALRHVEEVGRKYHSTMLVALAYRASSDPFAKVRNMLENMVDKLLQEAAEDATQKAFCDQEISKSKKSQSQKEESLAKTQARLDKGDASVAQLSEAIATLSKQVAEIDRAVKDATDVRVAEKSEFLKVEKDMSESEEACAAAISVLREYYEGASLVQLKSVSKDSMKGDGSGILGVLEVAESDFAQLLAEARSSEEMAAKEYAKMIEENKMLKATTEMDIKGKHSEIKSLKNALADYGQDKEGVTGELSAVLEYLDKLKPQCETNAPSYAQRKAEREAEIQGLKEALDILAGDALAFVQRGSHHQHAGPVETVGDAAGSVGSGINEVTSPVSKPVGDVGAGAVTTVGDGVGGAGQSVVGDNPMEKVPIVGSSFKPRGVSTALNCVVSLTIQYFVVYTALALCRTAADVWNLKYEAVPLQKILQTAAITVNYAPMLAVLFLAVRMRITWLTQGKGDPPVWMQAWMYCATYAVLLMTLVVVVIPLFTGEVIGVDQRTGDIDDEHKPFANFFLAVCFTVLKYFIMIGLYVGVVCIIYGACTFVPPSGSWPGDKIPPASPAVACTMILACMYFLLYAFVQFSRTWTQFTGSKFTKFENSMMVATNAMNFAPMLSVLFIGARMRALQMDPVNGAPQKWAQNCFFMCTYATAAQVLISIAVTLVLSGTAEAGKEVEGDMVYKVENKGLGGILSVGRYIIMFCIYIGFSCVIYSIFTLQHPQGAQYTPEISVTMQCVINLTFQFFFIYLMIWVCVTIKEFTGYEWQLLVNTMENLKGTVAYCPMLAILFVATRMRALLLTNNKGAPQGYVQDGMYMATWALLIQFLFGLIVPCCTGVQMPCDEDGTPQYTPAHPIALYAVLALKWISYIFLYGGVIAVITGVYTMTPENANGRGAVPLVGEHIGEPYGVNDIPGGPVSK
jgi:hypothetical protein